MPKRKTKDGLDYKLLALAAARLRSDGHTQVAIAKYLKTSQSEVSRALAFAKDKEWLIPRPSLVRTNISAKDWEAVDRIYFTDQALIAKLKGWAPSDIHLSVRVLPSRGDEFCSAASTRVIELVRRTSCLGIMYGRTVCKLINGIADRHHLLNQRLNESIECVPLCGDPLHLTNLGSVEYSASHLAALLEKILTGTSRHDLPSLGGVPAYVSRKLFLTQPPEKSVVRQFIQSIPGYQKIFGTGGADTGKGPPLIEKIDGLLTGAGIIAQKPRGDFDATATFIQERLIQEPIDPKHLQELIYGDIGGLLVEKEGLAQADQQLVRELNQAWIGITTEHLEQISKRAVGAGAPGIIVVASGSAKAQMIGALVKRGFVNQLVINGSLAKTLKEL